MQDLEICYNIFISKTRPPSLTWTISTGLRYDNPAAGLHTKTSSITKLLYNLKFQQNALVKFVINQYNVENVNYGHI